jgi:hypothetical protein
LEKGRKFEDREMRAIHFPVNNFPISNELIPLAEISAVKNMATYPFFTAHFFAVEKLGRSIACA